MQAIITTVLLVEESRGTMDIYSFSWWLGTIPLYHANTLRIFFIVFLSLVIIGALVRMISKRRLKDRFQLEISRRIASLLVVIGVLGLWYWFVAGQQIPFLSARFWLPTLVLLTLWWLYSIARYAKKDVPEARARMNKSDDSNKYFEPKRKK